MKLTLIFIVLLFFSKEPNSKIDFSNWKQQVSLLCKENCENLSDKYYEKDCKNVNADIDYVDANYIDSLYIVASNKIVEKFNIDSRLEYFVQYFFSGEYEDILYYFIFQDGSKFAVVSYSESEQKFRIKKIAKLSKKIIKPKSGYGRKKGIDTHFAILTKFENFNIEFNKIIFNPSVCLFEELIDITSTD